MRDYFENLEEQCLEAFAVKSKLSKGRTYKEDQSLTRTCFQRDRDRIIHSKSFRRLKDKTQVFVSTSSDHIRTRLTHSIEVSQISRHLARLLKVNEDLAECIALAHDLGHTPFGHSGEEELDLLLQKKNGFEHNLHSLKIVEELENKYPLFPGLNLSYEVKEGLKKHSKENEKFNSLEADLTNIADEIAYNNHDLEDGLHSSLIKIKDLNNVTLWKTANKVIEKKYSNLEPHQQIHLITSQLISNLIIDVFNNTKKNIQKSNIRSLDDLQKKSKKIVCFSPDIQKLNVELREFLHKHLYKNPFILDMNQTGKSIINGLFKYYMKNFNTLPKEYRQKKEGNSNYLMTKEDIVANYIAGMTDRFAIKQYNLLC